MTTCWSCNRPDVQYAPFTGGREFYCPRCEKNLPYRAGQDRPYRVQLLADGKFHELAAEMKRELRE